MAFQKRSFGGKKFGKKSQFVRVGNMFKAEQAPKGAAFSYGTTVSGEYLDPVAEMIAKAAEENGAVRFSLTKWSDQEHPVLSVAPAAAKPGKRIKKEEGGPEDDFSDSQDAGL
jgi:hypothetical protein